MRPAPPASRLPRADRYATPERLRPELALLVFAASFAVFQHVPSFAGGAADYVDLVTPFAVAGATSLVLLSLRAAPAAIALALVAGILYVDGHGIHLAANSIGHETLAGEAEDVTHFWDEVFGHIEWHTGWMLLIVAVGVAEALSGARRTAWPPSRSIAVATTAILGFTLFTSTVEGGTWWLAAATAAVVLVWAARARRPLLVTLAGAFATSSLLMIVWAIWQRGMPQFSDLGWL